MHAQCLCSCSERSGFLFHPDHLPRIPSVPLVPTHSLECSMLLCRHSNSHSHLHMLDQGEVLEPSRRIRCSVGLRCVSLSNV